MTISDRCAGQDQAGSPNLKHALTSKVAGRHGDRNAGKYDAREIQRLSVHHSDARTENCVGERSLSLSLSPFLLVDEVIKT